MRAIALVVAFATAFCTSSAIAEPDGVKSADAKDILEAPVTGISLVILRDSRRSLDPNQRVASVKDNWLYCTPIDNALYVVPKTYATDFASVPWYGRWIFPQFGQWAEASIIHDFLYDVGEPGKRAYADKLFKKAIEERTGKVGFASFVMYLAVRFGGGGPYEKALERDPEKWKILFLGPTGEPADPPYPQPRSAVWRTNQDCNRMNSKADVDQLLQEYATEFKEGRLPQQQP